MPLVIRQLKELGRQREIPLCNICFIDLQKAHSSVDGELFCKVLARIGMLQKRIVVICQFHTACGLAYGRTMANARSGFSGQEKTTARMCAITFAFQRVFAAVLDIILVCFGEDEGTLAHLVHLGEDGVGGEIERVDCIRKVVWGMLQTDDTGVVSKSPEGLTNMILVIFAVFEAVGSTVSEKKTKTILFRTPHQEPQ